MISQDLREMMLGENQDVYQRLRDLYMLCFD